MQRLADRVAGKFTYGVMAAAAATFLFWSGIGTRVFPQVGGYRGETFGVSSAVAIPFLAWLPTSSSDCRAADSR